ncbi:MULTISPECIES: MurR/RpiR family transcriptional regulator [Sinorhizobium]|uniref:RpiR family transcriptional regulator n=1 Tax=Rhizobium meliloti TaxID=382 RepID=A0A2J0Z4X9_RHIML|nr:MULTISPECIES: MurR/RpiR family transcriptional regulator [Sinorhizobium]GCA53598.1 helix-turn-helix domain, rpiR family [Sinorhizobium sp. KGO-5]PJR15587.1 RpiR family transcriptional regulator [Sinorhizobium meliloti]WEJ12573.1 MurR/RpiR family transcriptional regulator [Sinorhizobium sp. M103]WEJ19013.1 MurR/RpiR family transcriptional regulator [Sinorhizobium sp. K101]WEJ39054.1 MurR/RpiR family transcriptional regulator [Sinorhizobium sp. C101]
MSKRILKLVQSDDLRRSKSDKLIANYIERNIADLPFETARSIAQRLELSPMTVGRYLRRMGFDGLDELKGELRRGRSNPAWQVKAQVDRLEEDRREGKLLARLIQQQIDNLGQIYELTSAPEWQQTIEALVGASEVYVAAYQNVRGIAQYFASQLSYTRPRVQFVDGLNGTYAELLDGSVEGRLLFLHDVRRFASKAKPLALEARRAGVKVVLLTDEFCPWGKDVSDVCLVVPGSHGPLWDGAATMTAVMDLMLSNVIVVLGEEVSERVDTLTRLQDIFGDFEN